jgi:GH15 family glucan-1,4-alpha-glucosidase
VRLAELERGSETEIEIRVSARPDYARALPTWRAERGGSFVSKEAALYTNAVLRPNAGDLAGRALLTRDQPLFAVLDYGEERRQPDEKAIREWLSITTAFWHEWNLFNYYRGPHAKLVRRSAVTLKLLTYAETGGFVAAPTTSLPEAIGGDANWDYRFCWLRDTALFIQTLFGLGYSGEAKAFIDFAVKNWMEKNKKSVRTHRSQPSR